MPTKLSIVVDADIARSSGLSEHPVSSGSRKLLECITKHGHYATMCPSLLNEWKAHRSLFARKWLASMIARRKVNFLKADIPTSARNFLTASIEDSTLKEVALKDAHLVDAALYTNKLIASNDDRARNAFCTFSQNTGIWSEVAWVNAISNGSFLQDYLQNQSIMIPKEHKLTPP
ncbi:MAG: hypothetical protein AAGJ88_08175 [Pseudomonadota bacterium]